MVLFEIESTDIYLETMFDDTGLYLPELQKAQGLKGLYWRQAFISNSICLIMFCSLHVFYSGPILPVSKTESRKHDSYLAFITAEFCLLFQFVLGSVFVSLFSEWAQVGLPVMFVFACSRKNISERAYWCYGLRTDWLECCRLC